MTVTTQPQTLLQKTLDAAVADQQTVTPEGESLGRLPHGMKIRDAQIHTDDRGSVAEMLDTRWDFSPDPIKFAYYFSIRPGQVKGWGLHQKHEDRYFLLRGELELVLYDVRPDSPTCGEVSKLYLSEKHQKMISIPRFVWHADNNIGDCEALVVNFPTIHYDHSAPDKIRLPLDTPHIPYDFGEAKGW